MSTQALTDSLRLAISQHDLGVQQAKVQDIQLDGDQATVQIMLPYPCQSLHSTLQQRVQAAVHSVDSRFTATTRITTQVAAHAVQRGVQLLPGVKNIIAVASGKGGVGKSTTAVNLALALAHEGARVGVLDADIYGPSIPMMLGVQDKEPDSLDGKVMQPIMALGLQVMSIGFLVKPDQAMIWRGPMATGALDQLLKQTAWDDLDYLIVDMPPGTGDIQLTLAQRVPLTGAVIVTTPQDIALLDAKKGIAMFDKVSVPILGLVENMAVHVCSQCGHAEHIFGDGGGQKMAQERGIAYLGALPLALTIREQADSGHPTVAAAPTSDHALSYIAIAHQVGQAVAAKAQDYSSKFPTIVVSKGT